MNEAIARMLERYDLSTRDGSLHALREILQEVALLGLWRAKFFEHAAFYGGTALRILHGLDRFSEDLDFTLITPKPEFDLSAYMRALRAELASLGFEVSLEVKNKTKLSRIRSAFLKADTRRLLIAISAKQRIVDTIARNQNIPIRLEIDVTPPDSFETESRYVFQPIPFALRVCTLPDLFAGKMHAVLCRGWKHRVKGRDWYDFVWFAANHPVLRLRHLEARMRQSGHWPEKATLDEASFRQTLLTRIEKLDVKSARAEVLPFLRNPDAASVWSVDFFVALAERIRFIQ
jgi:predicted nucleotidyltransferase component of viral defense system